jgi:hypothetical protein
MNIDAYLTRNSLYPASARPLSNPTISVPMMEEISPRWLLAFLPWVPVEAGVYRVNQRKKCCMEMGRLTAPKLCLTLG